MMKKTVLALLWLACLPPAVQASEAVPEEFTLPELVVTATKTNIDKKAVPTTVEVITQADIKAKGAQTLKDVIGSAVGVSLSRVTGRDAISIRGFESRFSTILIDGKRISSEIDQNFELDRIPLENVERIEIVRGPASSLYGTDALGGIVNIITKQSAEPSFALRLDHGTFGSSDKAVDRYHFSVDSGKQSQIGVLISGSQFDNDRSLKSNGTTYAPFGRRQSFSARMDYTPSDTETFTFTTAYMDEDTREYAIKSSNAVNVHDDNQRYEYGLSYTRNLDSDTLFLRAYLSEYYKESEIHNKVSGKLMNYVESHRTLPGFEARYTKTVDADHVLTYGGEYRPEKFRGTGVQTGKDIFQVIHEGKPFTGSGIDIDYSALYVQDEWKVSPKLLAITSLRYDDSNHFESNISPKLGFTYNAAKDSRIKLSMSQGFRSPTPNQLYINSNVNRNGQVVNLIGNPNLESEKSNSYELAIEQDWGNATGKLTYFTNKVTDMIEESTVGPNIAQYQNIAKATLQGIEAELAYPLSDQLAWTLDYCYLDAVNDTTDVRLANRARHKIGSRLSYENQAGLRANLWLDFYKDYLFEDALVTSKNKTYAIWNLNLQQPLNKTTTLIFGVDNLFDKQDDDLSIQGAFIHTGFQMKF